MGIQEKSKNFNTSDQYFLSYVKKLPPPAGIGLIDKKVMDYFLKKFDFSQLEPFLIYGEKTTGAGGGDFLPCHVCNFAWAKVFKENGFEKGARAHVNLYNKEIHGIPSV